MLLSLYDKEKMKTIGIIGYGHVGKAVVKMFRKLKEDFIEHCRETGSDYIACCDCEKLVDNPLLPLGELPKKILGGKNADSRSQGRSFGKTKPARKAPEGEDVCKYCKDDTPHLHDLKKQEKK